MARLPENPVPLAAEPARGNIDPERWSIPGVRSTRPCAVTRSADDALKGMIERIHSLAAGFERPAAADAKDAASPPAFTPVEPASWDEAGLSAAEVEAIVLKYLLACGDATGREASEQVRLPFVLVDELLRRMKTEQLVVHKGAAMMNDFRYTLTESGREWARRHWSRCSYFGSATVSLEAYIASVKAQSVTGQKPTVAQLREAFGDLVLSQHMLDRLGPALNSGRGLFLYGSPGNGKTSIAERVTRAFGQEVWIPRAIGIDGEIIRLYDPANHEEIPLQECEGVYDGRKIDKRWVRIRRPTIIAGGELTMSSLEVTMHSTTGICEAPLQLKSNCGTLVIDDFGRQRIRIDELLNRWILPLEKRYDFLNLPHGKKIEVPFDQLIVFSTNLEPRDLVDEAFLRRVPYKIEVADPSEEQFRELFLKLASKMGFPYQHGPVEYLIDKHYRKAGRPFRYCHPRDLLLQVRNVCSYKEEPLHFSEEYFDLAVENYFGVVMADPAEHRGDGPTIR